MNNEDLTQEWLVQHHNTIDPEVLNLLIVDRVILQRIGTLTGRTGTFTLCFSGGIEERSHILRGLHRYSGRRAGFVGR